MISEFKIISITPKGEECLTKNLNEWKKLPPPTKLMWNTLFSRSVTHNPLTLIVRVKNSHLRNILNPSDLIGKLGEAMKSEGAKDKIDYKIMVIEK
jgi:hypothetical protein